MEMVVIPRQLPSDVLRIDNSATTVPIVTGHSKRTTPTTGMNAGLPQNFLPSPVARIPPEIIARVFQLFVDGRDEFTPVTVTPQGPFCLTQVCQLWRAIAESHPYLWTSINFYFPETRRSREEDIQRVQPVFDIHLERSGMLPLSLVFADHRTYSKTTKKLVCLLIDRLRTHSRRWRRISLHLSCGYFPLLFTFTPCDLSSLKYLHLSSGMYERFVAPPLNLESALSLRSLAYSGSLRLLNGTIDAHWERLEEVSFDFTLPNPMGHPSFQQFVHLPQCRNITTCSLGIDQPNSLDGDPVITLPHLRTLRVRRLSPRSEASFLNLLVLPQLQALEIDTAFLVDWYGSSPPWHDRNFSNLLIRSGCALRHLSIQDVDFPSDEVVRCLAVSHMLSSLRFIPFPRSQDITDVIHALDVSRAAPVVGDRTLVQGHEQLAVGNSGPFSPELREVTLATSQERCLDSMMAMLRSRGGTRVRAEKVAALQRVEVVFLHMPHRPDDQLGKVEAFREDLAQWVSECEAENESGGGERLEAFVVIDSPYCVEYITVE